MTKLSDLKTELSKHFGRITCWKYVCKEWNCVTEEEQITAAEEVLSMPVSGFGSVMSGWAWKKKA